MVEPFDYLELSARFQAIRQRVARTIVHETQIWWDSQHYRHSRALDAHVQRLRKKIEKKPDAPEYFLTVTGVGYRFMAADP